MTAPSRLHGVNLTGQGENTSMQRSTPEPANSPAPEQFDPSTWQIPTGLAGLAYHFKRAGRGVTYKRHNDHLAWRAWREQVEAAEADWEVRNEAARAEWQRACDRLREEVDARNIVAERKHKQNLIRLIMNLGVLPTVLGGNWKSGGKTTLLAYVGEIMSKESGRTCLLLPATSNTKTATSGSITGLTGDYLTLPEYEEKLDTITSPRELASRLARTKGGMAVIKESESGDVTKQKRFDPERFGPLMRRSWKLTDGCLLFDLGNDDFSEDQIPLMATRAADVIVFTATNTAPRSHKTMLGSIETLKTDPYNGEVYQIEGPQPEVIMPGELRSTADKIQHALVVINGVKPDDDEYDFDQLRTPRPHNVSERAAIQWEGEGLIVPFDDYIEGGHNNLTTLDLEAIDTATYDAYLNVALAILREGARAQQGVDLTELPEFTPELVQLPEFTPPPREEIPEPDYASNRSA